jgi:hypothetical protein
MHCQICLRPLTQHALNCPVATGEPVAGIDPVMQAALQRFGGQAQQNGLMGTGTFFSHQHDPATVELRIEWLEKEVHTLRARLARLEREESK